MSIESRLHGVERRLPGEALRFRFAFCEAPKGLSAEAHADYHQDYGTPHCFTLDLGAAAVQCGDDD